MKSSRILVQITTFAGLFASFFSTGSTLGQDLTLPPISSVDVGGLKVEVARRSDLPLVHLRLNIQAGSAADPSGKEGLASFTAQMVSAGAGKRSRQQLADAIDALGADYHAGSDRDSTYISLEVLASDFAPAMALLADLAIRPTFVQAEFESTQRRTLAEIQDIFDNPPIAATLAFRDYLYRGHPYGHPPIGYERTVKSFNRADVVNFHQAAFQPDNAFLVIVGDVNGKEATRLAKSHFGGWTPAVGGTKRLVLPTVALPAPIAGQKVVVIHRAGLTQSQIRIGNFGYLAGDADTAGFLVANTALGGGFTSRLTEEIRVNRSLSYSASSQFEGWKQLGPFMASTFTKNETLKQTIDVALSTIQTFCSAGMQDAEFLKARNYATGQFAQNVETIPSLARWLSLLQLYDLPRTYLTQYPSRLQSVEPDKITPVLQRIPSRDLLILLYTDVESVRDQLATMPGHRVVQSLEYQSAAE